MTATPNVRERLKQILGMTNPREELEALLEHYQDGVQFWEAAVSYLAQRGIELGAIVAGYTKSGTSVVAFVEALKARAGQEPEYYWLEDQRAAVYLWRTPEGPKLAAFEQAEPIKAPGGLMPCDWWQQLRPVKVGDDYLIGDKLWRLPSRELKSADDVKLSFEQRVRTPCTVLGCPADNIAECGHKSVGEAIGGELPAANFEGLPVGTQKVISPAPKTEEPDADRCNGCGNVKTEEEKGAVCRSPGCTANPGYEGECGIRTCSEALVYQGDGPVVFCKLHTGGLVLRHECLLCETVWLQSGAEKSMDCSCGATVDKREVDVKPIRSRGEEFTCGVCEGMDPESSDAPNSGHHLLCPIGDAMLADANKPTAEQRERDEHAEALRKAGPEARAKAVDDAIEKAEKVVHCSGAWVPPCTESFACSPCPSTSRRVYKYTLDGDQQLRDQLPGITCSPCREVIEAVMRAGEWCGPSLHPTSRRGWFPPVDTSQLDQGKANLDAALGAIAGVCEHTGDEDEACRCPLDCNCHPCSEGVGGLPAERVCKCGHVGMEHDFRTKKCARCEECPGFVCGHGEWNEKDGCLICGEHLPHGTVLGGPMVPLVIATCACGHKREQHNETDAVCGADYCACVRYRPSEEPPEPLVTEAMNEKAEEERKLRWTLKADMNVVRKQRKTKKGYRCCEVCLKPVTAGDEWVSEKDKNTRRAHLACADLVLLEQKKS